MTPTTPRLEQAHGVEFTRILSLGAARGELVVPNDDIVGPIDSSDEWIRQRTGVVTRVRAPRHVHVVDLAEEASKEAIEKAGITPDQIGIVLQETTLFGGTVRDNIAYGRPDAALDEIVRVARAAAAHDFIVNFPLGYETPVGERGSTLSGGQKQRIAIARALLMDPRILILDDSTSSVDMATEYKIQRALDQLMRGRTSFVIAQRISMRQRLWCYFLNDPVALTES